MNSLIILGVSAVIVQYLTELTKKVFASIKKLEIAPIIALIYGVVIAMITRIGIFSAFGIEIQPEFVDWVITGIAYSGGAVAFNELVKLISEMRPSNQNK